MIIVKGLSKEQINTINKVIGLSDYMSDERKSIAIKKWQKSKGLSADGIIGKNTLAAIGIDLEMDKINISTSNATYNRWSIEGALKRNGYIWYDSGDYKLNIVGIRNITHGNVVTNQFDDLITVTYKANDTWIYKEWAATTDPGKRSVIHFSNKKGVARLVANQYPNSYGIGLHAGKYEALRQIGNVTVYRDSNQDMTFDEVRTDTGLFGINIHKAGADSKYVENWSAGCQVFKRSNDFDDFMKIVNKSYSLGNTKFTYTLIDSTKIL